MRLFSVLAVTLLVAACSTAGREPVSVLVGSEVPEADACPALGIMASAEILRDAPQGTAAVVAPLAKGAEVYLCDVSRDGKWHGVVVAQPSGCGVSSPTPGRRAYAGPCQSGWVPAHRIHVVAG